MIWIRFELPNTDAYGLARTTEDMTRQLAKHGSPDMYYDELDDVWRIPAFRAGRIKYETAKAEACKRWGCE